MGFYIIHRPSHEITVARLARLIHVKPFVIIGHLMEHNAFYKLDEPLKQKDIIRVLDAHHLEYEEVFRVR